MKQLLALCLFLAFLSTRTMSAQNLDYRHTATLNIGQSTLGLIAKGSEEFIKTTLETDETIINIEAIGVTASPVFEGSYDFAIKQWFSLGISAANQRFSIVYTDFDFINDEQDFVNVDGFTGKMNRFNLTLRPNFHYGNNKRLDMYSGFRLGVTVYGFGVDSDIDSDIPFTNLASKLAKFGGPIPTGSLTLFGIRYFLTDNIGLSAEFNAGAPYFAKVGVAGRF